MEYSIINYIEYFFNEKYTCQRLFDITRVVKYKNKNNRVKMQIASSKPN